MTAFLMKEKLEALLADPKRTFRFDREKDTLSVEQGSASVVLTLPTIIGNWEEEGERALEKIRYYVEEGLRASGHEIQLDGNETKIFPVIRSTSFPRKTKQGELLAVDEHTAETAIFYVLDLGRSYKFIAQKQLQDEAISIEVIRKHALANVNKLPVEVKKDSVGANDFYFVRMNDGYDASRILNHDYLAKMRADLTGEMVLAVPHQDVLIIGDIRDESGYDVMAHVTMQFFAEGMMPITSLSFVYNDGKLEPIFILAKNRKTEE